MERAAGPHAISDSGSQAPARVGLRSATGLTLPPPPAVGAGGFVYVAYSGGLDSTVLLHRLLAEYPSRVRALHVHHGLQPLAEAWAEHCALTCSAWNVEFRCTRVQVDPQHPQGPEAAAREARYRVLAQYLTDADVLATAHHQDDQAETFVLHALRGSGPAGLSAMRPQQPLGLGQLWRPLLQTPRARLRAYAEAHGLQWVEDPQNRDARYRRSWLRQDVMPRLQLPAGAAADESTGAAKMLARSAHWCGEAAQLLAELATADLQAAADHGGLSVRCLQGFSAPRRKNAVRYWVAQRLGRAPPWTVLERLDPELLEAAEDAQPLLAWPGGELRRHRGRLHVQSPQAPAPSQWCLDWDGASVLELPAGGTLRAARRLPALQVRSPSPGERFHPRGGACRRTLKNLFQEREVAPWQRARVPVVSLQGQSVWIGGIGASQQAPVWVEALEWRVD